LFASHHLLRSLIRRTVRASSILVRHAFMNGAPVEMLFAKTSLADSLRALRAIRVSIDMFVTRRDHPTMTLSLQSSRRFDPKPFAVPLVLPPSSLSSLFSERAEPSFPRKVVGWDISLVTYGRYCSKSHQDVKVVCSIGRNTCGSRVCDRVLRQKSARHWLAVC